MLDRDWRVYEMDGTDLGTFKTRISDEILQLDDAAAKKVTIGHVLCLEEAHTDRRWVVKLTGYHSVMFNEFTIRRPFRLAVCEWYVSKQDGTKLGTFKTQGGVDVLQMDEEAIGQISEGDVLYMDDVSGSTKWVVEVFGNYRGRKTEIIVHRLPYRV